MKRTVLAIVVGFSFFLTCEVVASAGGTNVVAAAERRLKLTGGMILKPNSLKGKVKISNCQSDVQTKELRSTVEKLKMVMQIDIELSDGTFKSWTEARKTRETDKVNVEVFIVNDPSLPVSLIAPEERWGIVNVGKLKAGADHIRLFGRTRREMLRVFAIACGSWSSQYPSNALSAGDAVSELDMVDPDIPVDALNMMMTSLDRIGVTRGRYCTYYRACKEGWAPQPTNEYQKAVWEKVHKAPTKPIVIKPEPAKAK